jgi:hypothetical protein
MTQTVNYILYLSLLLSLEDSWLFPSHLHLRCVGGDVWRCLSRDLSRLSRRLVCAARRSVLQESQVRTNNWTLITELSSRLHAFNIPAVSSLCHHWYQNVESQVLATVKQTLPPTDAPQLCKWGSKAVPWPQAVSRRPLTAEARVRSRVSPCGICGGQSGTGTGFSPSTSVFPCQFYSIRCSIIRKTEKKLIIFITGLHNKLQGCGASVASAAVPFSTQNN